MTIQRNSPNPLEEIVKQQSEEKHKASLVIRLFLVRHGQTDANVRHIVAGQTESPLTGHGEAQARALGREEWFQTIMPSFWRRYVSDMERTQHTARLILLASGSDGDSIKKMMTLEPRLREVAKGAREGLPISMSYEEALEYRKKNQADKAVLKVETETEVWDRLKSWLSELVQDAMMTTTKETTTAGLCKNVLCVSHAGTIRLLLSKLVPDELPSWAKHIALHGVQRRLEIPNTSVTVLDLVVPMPQNEQKKESEDSFSDGGASLATLSSWANHSFLRVLTWHGHNDKVSPPPLT